MSKIFSLVYGGDGGGGLALQKISVESAPTRTVYKPGDAFDPEGMSIKATYSNGATLVLYSGYTWEPKVFSGGDTYVTISYTEGGATAKTTQAVTVSAETRVPVPSQRGTLTYTGDSQSPEWDNYDQTYMSISGDTDGVDAGEYTATFSLTNNAVWDTGGAAPKEVRWRIGKAEGVISANPSDVELGKEKPSQEVQLTKAWNDGSISCAVNEPQIVTAEHSGDSVNIKAKEQKSSVGSLPVGSRIQIKVGGEARSFIVIHQGNPGVAYNESCDGTWVIQEEIFENRPWYSPLTAHGQNDFSETEISKYLNGAYYNSVDEAVRSFIKQVRIPYLKGGSFGTDSFGPDGMETKVFYLSSAEVGGDVSGESGTVLDYFSGGENRVAYEKGAAAAWSLRTPPNNGDASAYSRCLLVDESGGISFASIESDTGVRPAFVLEKTFEAVTGYETGSTSVSVNASGAKNYTDASVNISVRVT